MENHYENTIVNDNFPLGELECQYFDICKNYDSDKCHYSSPCAERQQIRSLLESYVTEDNLKFQVDLMFPPNDEKK